MSVCVDLSPGCCSSQPFEEVFLSVGTDDDASLPGVSANGDVQASREPLGNIGNGSNVDNHIAREHEEVGGSDLICDFREVLEVGYMAFSIVHDGVYIPVLTNKVGVYLKDL